MVLKQTTFIPPYVLLHLHVAPSYNRRTGHHFNKHPVLTRVSLELEDVHIPRKIILCATSDVFIHVYDKFHSCSCSILHKATQINNEMSTVCNL